VQRCPSQSRSSVSIALRSDHLEDDNPLGWSKAQMNVLQHAQETASQDAWSTGNPAYLIAQDAPQHRAHFNMFNAASLMVAAPRWRQQEPALRRFLRILNHPGRKDEDAIIIPEIKTYHMHNPVLARSGLPKPHQNLLEYLHLYGNSDQFPGSAPLQPDFRDEGVLFCALGWYMGIEIIRQFSKTRNDIKLANGDIYIVLHTIGKEFFYAQAPILPVAITHTILPAVSTYTLAIQDAIHLT
jgi:hypothetical protein